jgi:RHS repeat-associated protein
MPWKLSLAVKPSRSPPAPGSGPPPVRPPDGISYQDDGAGRVTNSAVSYDTDETAYGDADDLTGDTVIEETRYQLDATGVAELVRYYQRRHNGTGDGGLTVGSSGNGRAQYNATWYDELHRQKVIANYGTNGGTDLTARPSGNPPSSSSSSQIVSKSDYTVKSELKELIDPEGKKHTTTFSDWRGVLSVVNNDVASPTENDEDRTATMTFNSSGQQSKITAVATGDDQETESVFGVTRGTASGDSRIASNDLVKTMKYPDPSTGAPGGADDQEHFAYNALGELMWKKDPLATEHVYEYDDRGRLIHDRVTVLGTGIDGAVRRISRTYDKLDRVLKITSYDNATVGSGSAVNETQHEYDKFGVVKKIYQDWTGVVNTGTSPQVQYAYSFPTDGTTGLRVTSVTHPDGTVVTYEYNSGTDDTLSRLSGKKKAGAWVFQDEYLGLGRLVQRKYGNYMSSEVGTWTLVGTDSLNNDNYVGLGRFGEIDDLIVKDSSSNNINRYLYTYNYNSQITFRDDEVGTVYGYYDFDEKWEYDDLGRLENHKRGRDLNGSPTMRVHECWTLDLSGNTTSFYTGTASTCGTGTSRTLNDSNEYTQVGSENYGYDKPGDMTDRGSYDKKYDAWKRLMSYENGSGFYARYKYNGLNQKVKRTDSVTGLADTYYYYSAENQLLEEEKVSDGSTLHYYVWGTQYIDDIVCRNSSGYNQFHVLDARNNVVTIILYNGTVDKRFLYESYGFPKQLSADWTTFQTINSDWHLFQGRQYCVDHEQYDFRNRFQDPELGVFVQRDPIGNWGDSGNFGNPYTFVGNDPLNRVDPNGENLVILAPVEAAVACVGPPLAVGAGGYFLGWGIAYGVEEWLGVPLTECATRFWLWTRNVRVVDIAPPPPRLPPPPPPPPSCGCRTEEIERRGGDQHPEAVEYENRCCPPREANIRLVNTCTGGEAEYDGIEGNTLLECKWRRDWDGMDPMVQGWDITGNTVQYGRQLAVAVSCGMLLETRFNDEGMQQAHLTIPTGVYRPIESCP